MDIANMLAEENDSLRNKGQPGYDVALPSRNESIDQVELASYIAQLSGEMAAMSRDARLDVIAYFLEMVRMEAQKTARRARPVTEIRADKKR